MKVLRLSSLLLLVALVLAVGAAPALAQCQLDGCTSNCAGGCGASSFPIQHPTFGPKEVFDHVVLPLTSVEQDELKSPAGE